MSTPVFLSIAGSDCSAGAGAQADLKTGFALGCYPLTALTCVVSEVPGCVRSIVPLPPDFVRDQTELCLETYPVRAVKCGMLYSAPIVRAVARALASFEGAIVIDPVMIATAGESLMQQEAVRVYEEELFPRATVLTPNCDELAALLSRPAPTTAAELEDAARALVARYGCAVLAKGGHLHGDVCTDLLVQPDGTLHSWEHARVKNVSTHGTGCTLSSALAAHLAHGLPLPDACARALDYTEQAIARSHRFGNTFALNHSSAAGA